MQSLVPALALALPTLVSAAPTPVKSDNPLLQKWATPFGTAPFQAIKEAHYLPAIKEAMARQKKEIEAIATQAKPATFVNTIEALDLSGELLGRVAGTFYTVKGAESTPGLEALDQQISPMLSAHQDEISLHEGLWKRVQSVFERRASMQLSSEQTRLLEKTFRDFVRGGANLAPAQKERFKAINAELSQLGVTFGANLLKETNAWKLVLDKPEDLDGLSDNEKAAAAETARKAGMEGKWLVTLQAPSIRPLLLHARNRELRRQAWKAVTLRCDNSNAEDNKKNAARIASLRLERSQLLGYPTFAHFQLQDRMAKDPARAMELLEKVWKPAAQAFARDAKVFQEMAKAELGDAPLEPWDWAYIGEKVKKAQYDLDGEALRPYFPLDKVKAGAFEVARKLYGITLTPRKDLPVYHEEVETFEVKEKDGRHVGILFVDYHPRPGKRSGAWCNTFRSGHVRNGQRVTPIVYNVGNFSRPVGNQAALLSLGEVETLFHEFGHALHALFSATRYPGMSSENVAWDFVELPSQIMENWAKAPEVLKSFAHHHKTGEPMPDSLIQKIQNAEHFNQGHNTLAYLASSIVDLEWHTLKDTKEQDAAAFEKAVFERLGLPRLVSPFHRTPHFRHIFSGGYAAGYYSYMWAEVLDADAFEAFQAKGLFNPTLANSFRKNILAKGSTEEPMALYKRFRGSEPGVKPLLKRRGLLLQ